MDSMDIKTADHYSDDGTVTQVHSIEEVLHNFYEVEKTRLEGVEKLLMILPEESLELIKKGETAIFSISKTIVSDAKNATDSEIESVVAKIKNKLEINPGYF